MISAYQYCIRMGEMEIRIMVVRERRYIALEKRTTHPGLFVGQGHADGCAGGGGESLTSIYPTNNTHTLSLFSFYL